MRRLADDEKQLWARVVATVKPLRRTMASVPPLDEVRDPPRPSKVRPAAQPRRPEGAHLPQQVQTGGGLDASWDRRLSRGLVTPDVTIDLHGHSLARAYETLDRRLADAIATGARVVLLVTGKPPAGDRFPVTRGAIRASIDAWLHASRHAVDVAAVRNAHPRHGGAGALYLILRRRRT